jgi:hypothetical protein
VASAAATYINIYSQSGSWHIKDRSASRNGQRVQSGRRPGPGPPGFGSHLQRTAPAPRMCKYRRAARHGRNGARWRSARSSTAVVRAHRDPVTASNRRRLHRNPHHSRCRRMCKLCDQVQAVASRCQIWSSFWAPLVSAACRLREPQPLLTCVGAPKQVMHS